MPKKARKKVQETSAIEIDDSESNTSIDYGKSYIAGCTTKAKLFYCLNNAKCGKKVNPSSCNQDNNLYFEKEFKGEKKFCSVLIVVKTIYINLDSLIHNYTYLFDQSYCLLLYMVHCNYKRFVLFCIFLVIIFYYVIKLL